ncbi:MAG TPA: hypothetical protein PLI17_02690, partial [Denitromonas sp.]|nr:hypothetical protein [Denitromonas sp.]
MMYVLFTRSGIIAAESQALATNAYNRMVGGVLSGEAQVIGIEYATTAAGPVAQAVDVYQTSNELTKTTVSVVNGDIEAAARSATGMAAGAAIAAAVAPFAAGPLAPVVVVTAGYLGGEAAGIVFDMV